MINKKPSDEGMLFRLFELCFQKLASVLRKFPFQRFISSEYSGDIFPLPGRGIVMTANMTFSSVEEDEHIQDPFLAFDGEADFPAMGWSEVSPDEIYGSFYFCLWHNVLLCEEYRLFK